MAAIFHLKRGDTSPALLYRLAPEVNLAGASVVFSMRERGGGSTIIERAAASIEGDPAEGVGAMTGHRPTPPPRAGLRRSSR